MTTKGKRIFLVAGLTVTAAGITYLIYKRHVNQKNAALFLEYVNSLPKTNTTAALNQIIDTADDKIKAMTNSVNVKDLIKGNPIIFDGKIYTDYKAAVGVAMNIATELNAALTTKNPLYLGTDTNRFKNSFIRIGSKNAMIIVNAVYQATYGISLWAAISDSSKLYHGQGVAASLASMFTDLPKYDPIISDVLLKLK